MQKSELNMEKCKKIQEVKLSNDVSAMYERKEKEKVEWWEGSMKTKEWK